MKTVLVAILFALPLGGCVAAVGTAGPISVPKDSPATCGKFCTDMGLTLSSVVVMANNVGCVCSAAPKLAAKVDRDGAAAVAGMATLIQQEEDAHRQQH